MCSYFAGGAELSGKPPVQLVYEDRMAAKRGRNRGTTPVYDEDDEVLELARKKCNTRGPTRRGTVIVWGRRAPCECNKKSRRNRYGRAIGRESRGPPSLLV